MEMAGLSWSLLLAAAGVAIVHTVLGPDHYLPFVMLARARGWRLSRTMVVTAACGVGHVASSVVLGGVGVVMGLAVARVEGVESGRGDLAAWALVALGVAYALWGVRRAVRESRGLEPHAHRDHVHVHEDGAEPHVHQHHHHHHRAGSSTTFWALFVVFVLGPCEPLLPLFVIPASRGDWGLAAITAVVFGVVTVGTMMLLTAFATLGISRLRLGPLERWAHSLAGVVIAACGLAILFLGL